MAEQSNDVKPVSWVAAAMKDGVDEEKCVVATYKTTAKELTIFKEHVASCPKSTYIDVEWVIDIADESNGLFYGTAYHYNDVTNMLHVMVPDNSNPSFDGEVLLDCRTVHLIECVDKKTDALFKKIVRDSVSKIKWDVEWLEENENGSAGNWTLSCARYFIRIANQLLVEDKDNGQQTRGFVILNADANLKLLFCHKNKGTEDFCRLINDGIVLSSPSAMEFAKTAMVSSSPSSKAHHRKDGGNEHGRGSPHPSATSTDLRNLSDMARGVKECLSDILEDRRRVLKESEGVADLFAGKIPSKYIAC
jgi:hypothetical protein